MKTIFYCLCLIFMMNLNTYAQNSQLADGVKRYQLPVVYLPDNVSVHFISPEPIQYVDISVKSITGDLPLKNVLRIKLRDSVKAADAVITIAGETFIAQYHVLLAGPVTERNAVTDIEIKPGDCRPLDIAGISLSQPQLKTIANSLFCRKPEKVKEHANAFGIKAELNQLYAAGDYIFLDLGYTNKTNLKYDIAGFSFKVDDKEVTKATNVQSVEVIPVFTLFDTPSFKKYYRNILVFKKMTFPGNKVLHIELSEKQLSGRVITLAVSYHDVLNADIIPLQ